MEKELENVRLQADALMREKRQVMLQHNEDLDRRETEIESMRIATQQKEAEKMALRTRLDEARHENMQLQRDL